MAYPTESVMATDAEIDAAVKAMRAIRTVGGKIHDDVLRAYARAGLEAANRLQMEEFRKRAERPAAPRSYRHGVAFVARSACAPP